MGSNLLVNAVLNGDQPEVRNIIENEDIDPNGYEDFCTALHYAMKNNQYDIVRTLLTSPHLKLDITDCLGWSGLHYACANNAFNTITVLGKDERCTENVINMRDFDNETPVMVAIRRGNKECVEEMVKLDGFDLRPKGHTPPIEFAEKLGYQDIVCILRPYMEQQELLDACIENNDYKVKEILRKGMIDVNTLQQHCNMPCTTTSQRLSLLCYQTLE